MSIFNEKPFDKIVVVDVETANFHQDSICQIGLLRVQNGLIVEKVTSLINPQTFFSQNNIDVHGITAKDVADAQPLNVFWGQYGKWFDNAVIVGQNVKFDLSALTKALRRYEIELPELTTLCTLCLAKQYLSLDKYKLEELCKYYHINVNNYHDSGEDAEACWNVLLCLNRDYGISKADLQQYKYNASANSISDRRNISYAQDTKVAQELKNIVEEIMKDGVIEEREVFLLKSWLDKSEILMGYYPYDKICETIYNILEDGYISLLEYEDLNNLFSEFIDPVATQEKIEEIQFEGKLFCLTGNFEYGEKSEVEKIIIQRGGTCNKGMSGKVNYLVVGGTGNEAWKFGNYGSKVQKALELQDKGKDVIIISEKDFFEAIKG